MNETRLKELLICVRSGTVSVDEAARVLRTLPYEDLEFSKVDHHRELRLGFPEVIFGEGKSTENIIGIVRSMIDKESNVLVTKLSQDKAVLLTQEFPEGRYNEIAESICNSNCCVDGGSVGKCCRRSFSKTNYCSAYKCGIWS